MQYSATLTQKGQITIPLPVRRLLGVSARDTVLIKVENKKVVVESGKDILALAGSVKPVEGMNALSAREKMEKEYQRV